jgi:hypothetical protein
LKHLDLIWQDGLRDVLRDIGRKFFSLVLTAMSVDAIDLIVEHCPNLQYLEVAGKKELVNDRWGNVDQDVIEETKMKLKRGLKKLAKLKVNGECVRFGTDWEGVDV